VQGRNGCVIRAFKRHGTAPQAEKADKSEGASLVAARHQRERCADAGKRRFYQSDAAQDRRLAQALRRTQPQAKVRRHRSAMSMLTFYINRGGKGLSAARKKKLEKAKDELRDLYGKN